MKTDNMTDEQMRVAIAEAMGWRIGTKKFKRTNGWHVGKRWEHDTQSCGGGGGLYGFDYNEEASVRTLPNYLSDLNACASFEEPMMMNSRYERYLVKLAVICGDDFYEKREHWSPEIVSATARQRAIAFLKTLP